MDAALLQESVQGILTGAAPRLSPGLVLGLLGVSAQALHMDEHVLTLQGALQDASAPEPLADGFG